LNATWLGNRIVKDAYSDGDNPRNNHCSRSVPVNNDNGI